jgi:hypothetical protein
MIPESMLSNVAQMIERYGAGPGPVTLTRSTPGAPDPSTPSTPGTPTLAVYTLDARVDGVAAEFIDGTTVIATDRMVIASPKATLGGNVVDIVPQMSDTLSIDGAVAVVKKIEAVPAAGPAARFNIFIAS